MNDDNIAVNIITKITKVAHCNVLITAATIKQK